MKREEKQIRSEAEMELLAELLTKSFSFDYKTIDDARMTVNTETYSYEFDATTLLPYSCNLNYKECKRLDELLNPFYKGIKQDNRNAYKELCERRILLYFLLCAPEQYRKSIIKKATRPDFILIGERHVGIEITKLTTPYDEEISTLVNQIHENGLKQEEDIEKHIKRYHKTIEGKITLVDITGSTNVSTGFYPLDPVRKHFAEEFKTKHDKYRNEIHHFDEFIILGDAASGSGLEISEQEEVQEVINHLLDICPEIIDTTTVIAWREAKHQERIVFSWYYAVSENDVISGYRNQ